MLSVTSSDQSLGAAWAELDGPDPVRWPGKNFELLQATSEFMEPEQAARVLNAAHTDARLWSKSDSTDSNVEDIYTLNKQNSPWKIRARLAGDGVHAAAEAVQYVLEIRCLVGTQEEGRYRDMEVARGTALELASVSPEIISRVESQFSNFDRSGKDYRIIVSREDETRFAELCGKSR